MRYLTSVFCVLATTAQATPPNVVSISDIYLGASDDQVFLLRALEDNLGLYSPAALDVYLIARSRTGATPDEVWPIRRKIDHATDADDPDETIAIPNAVDPFEIMADRDAWPSPINRAEGVPSISYDQGVMTAVSKGSVSGGNARDLEFTMPLATAIAQIVDGHAATRASLAQYPGMNGGTDSIYDFNADSFADECAPMTSGHLSRQDGSIDTLLIEFSCADAVEDYITARVFLVMPATPEG